MSSVDLFADSPARAKRLGAADDAIATIKAMIIEGKLQPHQRMPSEQQLATGLGVSRPTLREATRALIALNILEARHGDGTYVTSLAPELLAEPIDFLLHVEKKNLGTLVETREVLEAGVAALAAVRATEDDINYMKATVEEYGRSLSSAARCIELDQRFHGELASAARSPILASMISTVSMLAATSRKTTARDAAIRKQSDSDHRAILAAVIARDPERARKEMVAHLHHVAGRQ